MTTVSLAVLLLLQVPADPDDMSIPELEARFGANLLEPDPAGLGPPPGVRDDAVLHRWFGISPPRAINALASNDGNLVDSLFEYTTLDPALSHKGDPDKWQPGVADYAGESDDGLTVTVRIRPGITWQRPQYDRDDPKYAWLEALFRDGAPALTAEDFRFTHELALDEAAEVLHIRPVIEGSELVVLDRRTYQLRWSRDVPYAANVALAWQQVLPRFLYSRTEDGRNIPVAERGERFREHWALNQVCGYGPYEWVGMDPDIELVIRRKDDFPVFRPAIREIHMQIVRDGEQCVQRVLDGAMDFTVLMPQEYYTHVVKAASDDPFRNGEFGTATYEKVEYLYHAWNCRRPPFDDRRVRRAMGLAFNRELIFENVFHGFGAVVDGPVFYKHPHLHPGIEPLPFDLDAASALLDDAGWGDADGDGVRDKTIDGEEVDFRFTMYSFPGSSEYDAMMAIWKRDLALIGVDMVVETIPWGQMLQRCYREHDFDAFTGIVAAAWTLEFWNRFASGAIVDGGNFVGFRNDELDALADRHRNTSDEAERKRLALRIQEILAEEQPYTFFMRRDRFVVHAPWLENVKFAVSRPQLLSFGWYDGREK
ncbi:MAG: ABC transporter substrate-binding protein [Planctomycetota bacterium JB042]